MPENLEVQSDDNLVVQPDSDPEATDSGAGGDTQGVEPHDTTFSAMATPYLVSTKVDKSVLELKLARYFNKNRARFEKQVQHIATAKGLYADNAQKSATAITKGFRKGKYPKGVLEGLLGKKSMYAPIWEELFMKAIRQHDARELLILEDTSIREDEEHFLLETKAYFIPETRLPEGFDPKDIDATVVIRTEEEIARMVDRRIESFMRTAIQPVEKEGPLELGDGALVSITGQLNNKAHLPSSVKNHMIYTGDVEWESPFKPFANMLLGTQAGDRFLSNPLAWAPGELVSLNVVVHKVFSVSKTPSDEVVKSKGYENLEAWKQALMAEYRRTEAEQSKRSISMAIERRLQEAAETGPIPNAWIVAQVNDQYQNMLAGAGFDESVLLNRYGTLDRNQVYQVLANQMVYDLRRGLLLRAYAKSAGVDLEKGENGVIEWAESNIRVDLVTTEVLRQRREEARSADASANPVPTT